MSSENGRIDGAYAAPVGARLRAVVAVAVADRVRCQQPGCGHSIHAAIHIVEEHGQLLVLGSTCFAKRYGSPRALGLPQFGGGGGGRKLTDEEREMLLQNTQALLARFAAEASAARAAAAVSAELLAGVSPSGEQPLKQFHAMPPAHGGGQAVSPGSNSRPAMAPPPPSPWSWQKEGTSVAVFTAPEGGHWVRVQHRDGLQKLVPWPPFPGWESALPSGIGQPDVSLVAFAVGDIVEAIRVLERNGFKGPVKGRWQDVLPRRSRR